MRWGHILNAHIGDCYIQDKSYKQRIENVTDSHRDSHFRVSHRLTRDMAYGHKMDSEKVLKSGKNNKRNCQSYRKDSGKFSKRHVLRTIVLLLYLECNKSKYLKSEK